MENEDQDLNGSLEGEDEIDALSSTVNELKLNFELQSVQLEARLQIIQDGQRDMLKEISGNLEEYRAESKTGYDKLTFENERILIKLADLTSVLRSSNYPSKKSMEGDGSRPRVGFSQVTQDPITPIPLTSESAVKLDFETPSLDSSTISKVGRELTPDSVYSKSRFNSALLTYSRASHLCWRKKFSVQLSLRN